VGTVVWCHVQRLQNVRCDRHNDLVLLNEAWEGKLCCRSTTAVIREELQIVCHALARENEITRVRPIAEIKDTLPIAHGAIERESGDK
jgi:hypothetical protein